MDLFHSIPVDRGDETIRAALSATINRARANHLTPDGWSLAELGLDEGDVEWLQRWALALDRETARSWLLPDIASDVSGASAVRRAAIGVLLLLLTAEYTRRVKPCQSRWAMACSSCFNDQIRPLLFQGSEPTELYLNSLKQASERLHLRRNGGWGTPDSEWENIALQIALTESDLDERWPRWLRGENLPEHIVRLLSPEHGSPSFQQVWRDCQSFLMGGLTEDEFRAALSGSPWVLPRWADAIVAALHPRELTVPSQPEEAPPDQEPVATPAEPATIRPPDADRSVDRPPLEDIFESLTPYGGVKTIIRAMRAVLGRADQLGLRGRAWSLAELRLSDYDYLWLKIWAKRLQLPAVWFSTETPRSFYAGGGLVSFRAGLGGLLLLWIAETARRGAAEGELWPFIATSHFEQPVAAELFRKQQPSRFLREAMAAAARELGLRHALNDGARNWIQCWPQCWLDTAYLQFGFTWQGFKSRLPEWLSGQAITRAIRKLLDEKSGSAEFRALWQGLRDFRRGALAEAELRDLLAASPWVLPEWADDLIACARERMELEAPVAETALPDQFLSEPALLGAEAGDLHFVCRIAHDLSPLNLTEDRHELVIAGERRAMLLRQPNGSYAADPGREIAIHSNSSRLPASLIGCSGRLVASRELVLRPGEQPMEIASGAARLGAGGWQVVTGNEILTLEEARASLFKISAPQRRNSQGEWLQWAAMEGDEMAKWLAGRDEPFDSLRGLGAPLTVRSGPFNNSEDEFQIAASVVDHGLIEAAVCESLVSTTGRLSTGRLPGTAARVLRLKVRHRLEPGEKHFVVWWNENGEIGKLLPHYCEETEDGWWWVCKVPDTVSRFIAVALAWDGARLGAWWDEDWASLASPVITREPLLAAALLRWFRLPILARESAPQLRGLAQEWPVAFLLAWLKEDGLPEWLRHAPLGDDWLSAVRANFRLWWPDAETARQVLMTLAHATFTDRLNEKMLEVAALLWQVDPLLLAAILKAVKDRIVICSPTEIRLRLADSLTRSACDARKHELIATCAAAFRVDPNTLQADLLDCAARWLGGYELRRDEESNLALAAQTADARLLVALHLLERI